MIYYLRTNLGRDDCYINCGYLEKRPQKEKSLKEIFSELASAKKDGYKTIKLFCNTDDRSDFIEIIFSIRKYGFRIILETKAENFSNLEYSKKISQHINQYEVCYNWNKSTSPKIFRGIKNILKLKKKNTFLRLVLIDDNLISPELIINQVKTLGADNLKLEIPFKSKQENGTPSLEIIVHFVAHLKRHAQQANVQISHDWQEAFNPYKTSDLDFLDTKKAKVLIDKHGNKKRPLFSVIIPTYNKKKELKKVLNNFAYQDYSAHKFEIIVVDDGSTDGTDKMISKIKLKSNFKYIYWPRKEIKLDSTIKKRAKFHNRVALVRNIGIEHSRGDIILFNDDDILVGKDCLKKHETYHRKYSNIIVRGFRGFLPKDFNVNLKNVQNFGLLDEVSVNEKDKKNQEKLCRMYNLSKVGWQRVITSNLSVRKKYLEKAGYFHLDSAFWGFEDVDLGYRLSKLKMKFVWDNKIKVYHQFHSRQTGSELNTLCVFWINLNILYRKYLNENLYYLYKNVIFYKLDDLIE